jgi:hypothetical protein
MFIFYNLKWQKYTLKKKGKKKDLSNILRNYVNAKT